jgi:hypothetical protein
MTEVFWLVLAGQIVFAAGLATSVAIVPSYVLGAAEGGVSNYGSDRRTVVPFTVSFGGYGTLVAVAAGSVRATMALATWMTAFLTLLALLLYAVLVTAWIYKRSETLRTFHFASGIALLTYESFLGLWLAVYVDTTWIIWLLWAVMLVADAVCILALKRIFEKLFAGQVTACIAFGAILLIALA